MICKNSHIAIIVPILNDWDMGNDLSGNGRFLLSSVPNKHVPLNLSLTLCGDPIYQIFQFTVQPQKWLHHDLTHITYHWDNREHPRTACKVVNTLPGTCLRMKGKIWQLVCYEGRTSFSMCSSSLSAASLCFGCHTGIILPPCDSSGFSQVCYLLPCFSLLTPSLSVSLTFQCRPCCS